MATNFPTSLDTLTNPTSSDSLSSPSHSAQHANVNDAVEALQAKVGADSSAVTSSHDYKIADHASRITTLEGATNGGMVPLVTEDFTSVSAVNIDNVFTADYRAYKIVFRLTGLSANVAMLWRLRAGGVSKTANYNTERLYGFGTTPYASENPSGTDDWYVGSPAATHNDKMMFEATLFDPYSTNTKVAISQSTYRDSTYHVSLANGHYLTDTNQLDGMTVFPSSGTFSGTITIYGMVEAS